MDLTHQHTGVLRMRTIDTAKPSIESMRSINIMKMSCFLFDKLLFIGFGRTGVDSAALVAVVQHNSLSVWNRIAASSVCHWDAIGRAFESGTHTEVLCRLILCAIRWIRIAPYGHVSAVKKPFACHFDRPPLKRSFLFRVRCDAVRGCVRHPTDCRLRLFSFVFSSTLGLIVWR